MTTSRNPWARRALLKLFAVCAAAPAIAVAASDAAPTPAAAPLSTWSHQTQQIQSGERLVLLGVTADDHALVQDGATVYATALQPGAPKQVVGTSPPGVVSFVYTVGKVAFVWTNPDRSLPGFGVSPLTVWSAASGAHQASTDSPIGTFTTSASADGRHVMYTTRGSADGSVGDIEFAATDLSQRRTLVAEVPMAFPFGVCRPWGSFVGIGERSHPVALFCDGAATTATLASWSRRGDGRRDLLGGVLTQPYFTASPDGRQFFTALADTRTPVVVSDLGEVSRLEEGVLSRRGFFTSGDDVYYSAFTDLTLPGETHHASLSSGEVSTVAGSLFSFLTAQAGSDLIVTPPSSPDGRKLAYLSGFDPLTFLTDVRLAHLDDGGSTVLAASQQHFLSGPVFSADSRYTLFARVDDPSTGVAQLLAAGPSGSVAPVGQPGLQSHDRLHGSHIVFNDTGRIDPVDFFASTARLQVARLSQLQQVPALIDAQAYLAFLPARGGHAIAYTTPGGLQGAGLYLAHKR